MRGQSRGSLPCARLQRGIGRELVFDIARFPVSQLYDGFVEVNVHMDIGTDIRRLRGRMLDSFRVRGEGINRIRLFGLLPYKLSGLQY